MFFWLNFCSSSISSFKLCKLEMKLTSVYFISHQSIYTLIKVQSGARQQPSSSSSNILQVIILLLQGADISHVLRDHFCIVYIRWLLREGSTITCSLAWAFLQMKIAAALRGLSSTFVCFDQRLMLNVGLGFFRCFFFQFYFQSLLCRVETHLCQTVTEMYLVTCIKISWEIELLETWKKTTQVFMRLFLQSMTEQL